MPINDPGGGQFYTCLSAPDYRSAVTTTWWVDVTGILDPATGVISWTFRMLDPATSDLPVDALAGFLPPNDETGRGEGHVSFVIDHVGDIPLGSQISNQASIVFDINDPIVTNRVFNTIDQIPDNRVYLPLVLK